MKKTFLLLFISLIVHTSYAQFNASQIKKDGVTIKGNASNQLMVDTSNVATKLYVQNQVAGGGASWGGITGTLSNQTDLQTALNAKLSLSDTASMLTNYLRKVRTITINGTTYDLSADRTWTVVPSLTSTRIGFGDGSNLLTSNANLVYSPTSYFGATVADGSTFSSNVSLNGSGAEVGYLDVLGDTYSSVFAGATHTILAFANQSSAITTGFHAADREATMGITNLGGNNTTLIVDDATQSYTLNKLGGGGAKMVTTDNVGVLGTASIPSGTVTSVALSTPTGLSISGSPITSSGTLALSLTSGYVIPTTTNETNWNSAYTNRITSLTTTGSSGSATLSSNTLNIPTYTLSGLGGITQSAADSRYFQISNNLSEGTAATMRTNLGLGTAATQSTGTFLQTSNNLSDVTAATARTNLGLGTLATQSGTFSGTSSGTNTGDQTITLTGNVTGSGTGSFATTIANSAVTNAMLAGSIDLTSKVTGALPIANGGTNATTALAARANLGTFDTYKTADQTTGAGVDTVITFASAFSTSASETWSFECYLVGQVSGSGGAKFTVVYSNAPSASIVTTTGTNTTVNTINGNVTIATTPAQTATMWAAATSEYWCFIRGSFTNGASANTITIKVQPVNGAQTVTIRKNSYITARRIN